MTKTPLHKSKKKSKSYSATIMKNRAKKCSNPILHKIRIIQNLVLICRLGTKVHANLNAA